MPRITNVFIPLPLLFAVATLLFTTTPAQARIAENVHYDYAPVLQAQPVIQTVQATHTHEYCTPAPVVDAKPVSVPLPATPQPSGFLQHLRALLATPEPAVDSISPEYVHSSDTPPASHCQHIEAGTTYQRIVAWDVDYIYQGKKYRSRLPLDPGNCVRLRVSITPLLEADLPLDTLPR